MKQKKYLIITISIVLILLLGITLAWPKWRSTNTNISINSDCFTINYSKGQDISNAKLKLLNESTIINNNSITITTGMALTTASIGIDSSCNIEGYGILKLNVTSLSDAFTTGDSVGSLKYAVVSYNPSTYPDVTVDALNNVSFAIRSKGSITSTGTKEILVKQLSNSTVNNYIVIIYIDGALAGNNIIGSAFSGTISAEAEQGKLPAAVQISKLYSPNTTAVNNSITYNLDSTNSLMKDVAGNIRYYGKSPNNYIYFNCETYPETNCEKWRIIGVFGDKIKLIRNDSIGDFSWDNKLSGIGTSTSNYGSNDWTDARLMMLLNPGYEATSSVYSYKGSLYWNSKSGTCYSGYNNATASCNFTSTGLKNDTTRNMIAEVTWNLGGWSVSNNLGYPNQPYEYERGTTVYSGRPTTWTGKIALMYPSDYGYAADLTQCNQTLDNYKDVTCTSNNWLYNSANQRLLTPFSSNSDCVWHVHSSGAIGGGVAAFAQGVRPVLYLNSKAIIGSGDGSSDSPYRLSVS